MGGTEAGHPVDAHQVPHIMVGDLVQFFLNRR